MYCGTYLDDRQAMIFNWKSEPGIARDVDDSQTVALPSDNVNSSTSYSRPSIESSDSIDGPRIRDLSSEISALEALCMIETHRFVAVVL